MNHNYGSEKVLNCNNNFFGAGWHQQEPNVNSWLDYNYVEEDTYHNNHYSGQSNKNHDYILNFDENHNNNVQYYQQQQTNVTEYNYDMSMRYSRQAASHIAPVTTTTTTTLHETPLSGFNSNGGPSSVVHQGICSPELPLLNNNADFYQVPVVSPVSSDRSSVSESSSSRTTHIYAEKKRRQNIKQGFDALRGLIEAPKTGYKISNARLLTRSRDHIKQLKNERATTEQKIKTLQQELKGLNESVSSIQETLPMMGVPKEKPQKASDFYQAYLQNRTSENWKFWIFAKIFNPVVQAVITDGSSSTSNGSSSQDAGDWIEKNCPMIKMRLAASNMLREVSLNTDLLTKPGSKLEEEIGKLVNHKP